jgi:magnesium chelatase family protein
LTLNLDFNKYATNPSPCGYHSHPEKDCVCGPAVVKRYFNKNSEPLPSSDEAPHRRSERSRIDRIDLHVEVTPVNFDELAGQARPAETSRDIAGRVARAREIQAERFKDLNNIYRNAQMPSRMVREVCQISQAGNLLVKKAMEKLQLSARAYDRILKVARTAADLGGSEEIRIEDLAEAIHFRSLDRESWAG